MRYLLIIALLTIAVGTASAQEAAGNTSETTCAPIEQSPDGRDLGSIRVKVNEIKTVVQTDYEVLLATNPEAEGTVTLSFAIAPEGTVTDAEVECTEDLVSLQADILMAVEELEFEPSSEQTENIPVTVPFTLTPPQ